MDDATVAGRSQYSASDLARVRTDGSRECAMKTLLVLGALLSLVARLAAAPAPAGAQETAAISLGLGNVRFWDGEGVDRAQVPGSEACDLLGPCWEYKIRVNTDEGKRLRIALTTVFRDPQYIRPFSDSEAATEMIYDLQVIRPGDKEGLEEALPEGSTGHSSYSVEVLVGPRKGNEYIDTGVYTVRVIPVSVVNMAFRMRAAVEGDTPSTDQTVLSPNLRIIPPFEIGFQAPTATYGPGVEGTDPRASCMAEEIQEAQAAHYEVPEICLRYSMGVEDAGPGAFGVVVVTPCTADPGAEYGHQCPAYQGRWSSDHSTFEPDPQNAQPGSAGYATFHVPHAHWHYRNIYEFELLRVPQGWRYKGPAPELPSVGEGRKLGANPGNEVLADWGRVYQGDRSWRPNGHNGVVIGLNSGWGDIYEYNRGGNYIDFTDEADVIDAGGPDCYVLRGTTDPLRKIIETNERDNVGYAFICIDKDYDVTLIERGLGTDPWDPNKVIYPHVPV